jgi:hypothetical protein
MHRGATVIGASRPEIQYDATAEAVGTSSAYLYRRDDHALSSPRYIVPRPPIKQGSNAFSVVAADSRAYPDVFPLFARNPHFEFR